MSVRLLGGSAKHTLTVSVVLYLHQQPFGETAASTLFPHT